MRDEWPSYDEWPYALEEESFLDHYADEIEDRVIPALDSDEVPVQQLTLFGGAY